MTISIEELKEIKGGGIRWVLSAIAAAGIFISGFLDGFFNSNSCSR